MRNDCDKNSNDITSVMDRQLKVITNLEKLSSDISEHELAIETISKKYTVTMLSFENISKKFDKTINSFENLKETMENFKNEIHSIDCRLIEAEQYPRRESIVISGIPTNISQKELEPTVIHILKTIGLEKISPFDIVACHRLPSNNSRYPANTIVKFYNPKLAEFCMTHRDRLVESKQKLRMNLRFYRHLCPANEKTLKDCKNLKRYNIINDYFVGFGGFVKIVKAEGDPPMRIKHPNILRDMLNEMYPADV